jgi:hypothetical protein
MSEFKKIIENVPTRIIERAFEYVRQSAPLEKRDDVNEYIEKLKDLMQTNNPIDISDVVAEFLNPNTFNFSLSFVEEFLEKIVGDREDAESIIAGTIEQAKSKLWSKISKK